MTRWKEIALYGVLKTFQEKNQAVDQRNTKDTEKIEKRKQGVVNSFVKKYLGSIKQLVFQELKEYKYKKQNSKERQILIEQKLQGLRQRLAVQKWLARTRKTIKCRQNINIFKTWGNGNIYKMRCFGEWKNNYTNSKKFESRIDKLSKNKCNQFIKWAFLQLRQQFHEKSNQFTNQHLDAAAILRRSINAKDQYRISRAFKVYQNVFRYDKQRSLKLKQLWAKRFAIKCRSYFHSWRRTTLMIEVVHFHNDYGHVRLQTLQIQQNIKYLKQLLIKDGYYPKQITDILQQNEQKYLVETEKSLCRLFACADGRAGENDTFLLPWCLDKWKQYIRERRVYRFWIKWLERRIARQQCDPIRRAFEIWALEIHGQKDYLQKKTAYDLLWKDYRNRQQKLEQAEIMEQKQEQIDQMRAQRQWLLRKVIGGQKLALELCNSNYKSALAKAFEKLHNHKNKMKQNEQDQLGGNNMNMIEILKKKIQDLEKRNRALGDEKDRLRNSTMESMNQMSIAEELQRDLERLTNQLKEKANKINTLIKENTQLTKQI